MFSQTLYVLCSSLVVSYLCLIRCSHKPCMFCVPHWLSVISAWSDVLTNLVCSVFVIGCQVSLPDPMFSQTLYVLCSSLVVSNLCMIRCSHKPCMFCVPHWLSVISAWSDVLTNLVCSVFLIGCQLSLHDPMFSQTLYVLCSSLVVSYLCMIWWRLHYRQKLWHKTACDPFCKVYNLCAPLFHGSLILVCVWNSCSSNTPRPTQNERVSGDLRLHDVHFDVTVIQKTVWKAFLEWKRIDWDIIIGTSSKWTPFTGDVFKCIFLRENVWIPIHWNLFLRIQWTIFQHWFR